MSSTISHLFNFQSQYLKNLLENIPDNLIYEKHFEEYNSPGWLLGHLCVEAEDVFNFYNINDTPIDQQWINWFQNSTGAINENDSLPSKKELLSVFNERYSKLNSLYNSLSEEQLKAPSPSKMLKGILPDSNSWIAHHLTTHISVHCGNIVVWKKMMGLKVGGY